MTKKRLQLLMYIVSSSIFVFCIIRGAVIANRQVIQPTPDWSTSGRETLTAMNDGWILWHEDGSSESISLPYTLDTPDQTVRVTRVVEGLLQDGDAIRFNNLRQGVTVYADETVIGQVNTTKLTSQLFFNDVMLAPIPDAANTHEISIVLSQKARETYTIPEITVGSWTASAERILHSEMPTLIVLSLLGGLLLIGIAASIVCAVKKLHGSLSFDLSIFVLTAINWGFADSNLLPLLGIPHEVVGIICYLSLMALPIPMCQFIHASCARRHRVFPVIAAIAAVNVTAQALLSCFGVIRLQNTFVSAHVIFVAMVVSAMICFWRDRKKSRSREMDILYAAMLILAFGTVLSLVFYWMVGGVSYRLCMLICVLLFSLNLALYVAYHYEQMIKHNEIRLSEARIHERLALQDALTGLPNRRAFEADLDQIERERDTLHDAVLIMMDLNGLKNVNDRFGHASGDDLIVSAAQTIRRTYERYGTCYRIGGDEFVVILRDPAVSLEGLERDLDETIDVVNNGSRWKLSIARGHSHLQHPGEKRLSISDWKQEADVNMYRNKLSMTGTRSHNAANDFREIIRCIVSTVEAKDTYTAAHSDRVRELSCCIAQLLGTSDATANNVEVAARLHDIGKIGIPDYILLKPDRLTDTEYETIKEHSAIGAHIIRQARGMQEIAAIVLHHHERWDGKGYPERLSREDIPLESRIIAVADSIDAMTSRRVYREGMCLDDCRAEIEKQSGRMYDPAIAQIVLANWHKIVDIVMLHPKRLLGTEQDERREHL